MDLAEFFRRCVMSVAEGKGHDEFAALGGCFVGGDAEQRKRQRRLKRRALAISVTLQALVLAAVILLPLFGKTERIALAYAVPIPPYSPYAAQQQRPTAARPQSPQNVCHFCAPTRIPPTIAMRTDPMGDASVPSPADFVGLVPGNPNVIPIFDTRHGPTPPPPGNDTPRIVHVTHLDPAMLTRRIEPVYPRLAIQTRREGRVELHAIIGTDGAILALQVVSGDVLFYESAKDAVLQWRYKPTYLNNRAVEVDTTITVIYTLGH
jgi:TonB family protein